MDVHLSPPQQQVVGHRGSPLQVIACAGSGKTESISRRVAALIAEGAEPASIIAFTFTERAAAELKERIVRRVAERMGEGILLYPAVENSLKTSLELHGHPVHLRTVNLNQEWRKIKGELLAIAGL